MAGFDDVVSGHLGKAFIGRYAKERTRKAYGSIILWFLRWCKEQKVDPRQATPVHFDLIRAELTERHALGTAHLYQTAISQFYEYLVSRKELATSPIPTAGGSSSTARRGLRRSTARLWRPSVEQPLNWVAQLPWSSF